MISDTAATGELWQAHADAQLQFATVLVGPADAYDIVIEAVLRSEPIIDAGGVVDVRGYLMRTVTNRARDLYRSRRRRWRRDLAAVRPVAVEALDSFVDVRRAVASLSVMQRAVVFLAYWDDLSERRIAEVLQVSPGTIRRHLVRAKAHLRKALR